MTCRLHPLLARLQLPPRFELQDGDEICRVDDGIILGSFVVIEDPFVGSFREDVNPHLDRRINTEFGHAPGRVRVKAATQRIEESIESGDDREIVHEVSSARQREGVQDVLNREQQILAAIKFIGHRRCVHASHVDVPERAAGDGIEG